MISSKWVNGSYYFTDNRLHTVWRADDEEADGVALRCKPAAMAAIEACRHVDRPRVQGICDDRYRNVRKE